MAFQIVQSWASTFALRATGFASASASCAAGSASTFARIAEKRLWAGILWSLCALLSAESLAGVEVRLASGTKLNGTIRDLTSTQLQLQTSDGLKQLQIADVVSLVSQPSGKPKSVRAPATQLELHDGSLLVCETLVIEGGRVKAGLTNKALLELPLTGVGQIRFRDHDEELEKQWREIVRSTRSGDALVIRKILRGGDDEVATKASTSLDYLEGVVKGVSSKGVRFAYDGDTLEVKMEKVDGIVFQRQSSQPAAPALFRVFDHYGSKWNVANVTLRDGQLYFDLAATKARLTLAIDEVARIDFSSGNTIYLTDEVPEQVEWHDFSDQLAQKIPALRKRYEPKWGNDGEPLSLSIHGIPFERGLAIHPFAKVVYRLPQGFRRVRATVGMDDAASSRGDIELTVLLDGRELAKRTFSAADDEAWTLDEEITGGRRLELRVSTGSRLVQFSQLDLGDLRISK